jgi:hypothetical protein
MLFASVSRRRIAKKRKTLAKAKIGGENTKKREKKKGSTKKG